MPIFRADDYRLEYSDKGTGVPLLLIPGLLGAKECFQYQTSALADRCRIIAFTPAVRTKGRALDLDYIVDQSVRLLKHLGVPSAVIVGHGAGALAAVKLASGHPDCCLGLILHSCAPSFVGIDKKRLIQDMLPGKPRFDGFVSKLWKKILRIEPELPDANPDISATLINNVHLSSRGMSSWTRVFTTVDVSEDSKSVGAPTLIACGSEEPDYILAGSKAFHDLIDVSTLEVIEGVGAFAFYYRYDLFNQLIEEFLADRVPSL